jgi:predicted negative regulator of RcsB-dependent stress response
MLNRAIDETKNVWNKHKYKILAGVSFAIAGYFAWKYM